MRSIGTRNTAAILAITLSVSLVGRAAGAPITLDFEGLPAMTFVSRNPIPAAAQLSDQFLPVFGVTFSSGSDYVAVVELGAGHATSGVNGIGGSRPDGILTYDSGFPVVARFFDPSHPNIRAVTDFVSVRGDHGGSGLPITLNAFDVHNQLIGSFTTIDDGGATLTLSIPGIHFVQFLGTLDDGGVALDDFSFNAPTAVAEPASTVLLGTGVASIIASSRRRRDHRKR